MQSDANSPLSRQADEVICVADPQGVQRDVQHEVPPRERAASLPVAPESRDPSADIVVDLLRLGSQPCLFTMGAVGRDQVLDGNQLLARVGGVINTLSAAGFRAGPTATLYAPLGPSFVGASLAVLALGGHLRLQPEPTGSTAAARSAVGVARPGLAPHSPRLSLATSRNTSQVLLLDELADWPDFGTQATSFISSRAGTVSSNGDVSGFLDLVAVGRRLLGAANIVQGDLLAVGGSAPYGLCCVAVMIAAFESRVPVLCFDSAYARRHPQRIPDVFRTVGVSKVWGLGENPLTIADYPTSFPNTMWTC